MFYYVNVNGMPRQAITETMHQLIRNTKIERDDCDIIQQYFPMQHDPTRVDVVTVPELKIENTDLAQKIHKNIEKIVGSFEANEKINTIDDL